MNLASSNDTRGTKEENQPPHMIDPMRVVLVIL